MNSATQGGQDVNFAFTLTEVGRQIAYTISRCVKEGIVRVEPTIDAEEEWNLVIMATLAAYGAYHSNCTPGYLNNPAANAESFRDGWFRTGDRGVLEDGYLRLEGRIKEMILRGGENISPYEIESVLGTVAELPVGAVERENKGIKFHIYQAGGLTMVFWQDLELSR